MPVARALAVRRSMALSARTWPTRSSPRGRSRVVWRLLAGRLRGRPRTPQLVDHPIQVQTLATPVGCEGVGIEIDALPPEPSAYRRQRPARPVGRRRRFRQRTTVRLEETDVSVGIQGDAEPVLVHRPVVTAAQQHQVVKGRCAPMGPVHQMVTIAAPVPASRKPTLTVAGVQRPAQGRRDGARPAADVEDLAAGAVLSSDRRRVAGQPPSRLPRDVDAPRLV